MEEHQPRCSSSRGGEGSERMAGSGQALVLPQGPSVPGPAGGVLGRRGAWCAPRCPRASPAGERGHWGAVACSKSPVEARIHAAGEVYSP